MTSFYNDLGAKALEKHGIETSNIASDIRLNTERNKSLFIHAFTRLLRDEYGFKIIGQLASDEVIKGMITTEEVREEDMGYDCFRSEEQEGPAPLLESCPCCFVGA